MNPLLPQDERTFPTLTPAQIRRFAARGRKRSVRESEILVDAGDRVIPFFVVLSGELETVRPAVRDFEGEALVTVVLPGHFTGEISVLSGRAALFRIRVSKAGEVIELDRQSMLALVQADAELNEIVMRAFISRRLAIVGANLGDVVLLGSAHSRDTLRLKEFLTRNGHPYQYVDLDGHDDVRHLMDAFDVSADEIPVLICHGRDVLRNPSNRAVAECLGFNEAADPAKVRDLVIIGAGPAGLAAAVYGASEGLDTLMIEATAPGGQAGTSSRIENYLGFPTGVSGQELAGRAFVQAEKFGAQMLIAGGARLHCDRQPYTVETDDGRRIPTRSIVIATGVEYRKLPLAELPRFEGAGCYYAATKIEVDYCGGEDVIVVGGANSAGQAAVFLSERARRVCMLIRGDGLSATMSRYLVARIEETPNIEVRPHTEIVALEGGEHLERVRWRNNQTGETEERPIRHVFLMTGGAPNTAWLDGCVVLDEKGFIKTGPALAPRELQQANWPLARAPFLLETTLPRVFAVGDVRSGSVKRVASGVGEGSIAISLLHEALKE
ncbi:MAG TPA: FAD-dependent oxidoreductase [Candidatus Cybelea sp.]